MNFNLEKGFASILLFFLIPIIALGSFFSYNNFKPAENIRAVYLTSWSSSTEGYIRRTIDLAKETEINAVVIDIKDWSGFVSYDTNVSQAEEYGAERIFVPDIRDLIKRFHDNNITVIARIVVFQDPVLASARPELAIKNSQKEGKPWEDNYGLAWIDPASQEAWEYNAKIAKDALQKGFDEVNFDYVRFPSDGDLKNMEFTVWDRKTAKNLILKQFFKYLRKKLPEATLSVDLFGLSTVKRNDLGVGQLIEDAFPYFDYVCPMVYPSHYAKGFQGFENPAENPYQVVYHSINQARARLNKFKQTKEGRTSQNTKIRPWLQDFNLRGVDYGPLEVRAQIKATQQALGDEFSGFMMWSSKNIYTRDALRPFSNPIFNQPSSSSSSTSTPEIIFE